jgi:O-antigen/teichoic acid export membrane protein
MIKKLLGNQIFFNIASSLGIKMISAFVGVISSIVLARYLGATDLGVYSLAISIITIITIFTKMGLDNTLIKFASYSYSINDWMTIKGLHSQMIKLVLSMAIPAILIICLFSDIIAIYVFDEPKLGQSIRLFSLAIIPISLIDLYSQLFKGIDRIKIGMFMQSMPLHVFIICLILIFSIFIPLNLPKIISIYVLSSVLVLIACSLLWGKFIPSDAKKIKGYFSRDEMMKTSIPLMWVASLNLVFTYMDTFMIGMFMSSTVVGLYNVASKVVLLSSMILVAINGVVSQKFSVYWETKKKEELERLAQSSTCYMFILSIIVFLFYVIFNRFILNLYGQEYIEAWPVLLVLAIGQFVVLATGPVASLLMMTGNGKFHKNNTFVSALINFVLNLLFIPFFGIVGAAVATAISLIVKNLLAVIFVRKNLGINVFSNWGKILKSGW